MPLNVVRVLGWLVIAHGLSHAVLPLRGSTAPAWLIEDWVPVGLYMIGMVGFVGAGLGMLGLRPLDRAISPVLVLASGLSLVAIVRLGDPTLWFGAGVDAGLLVIGLWRAYGGWPAHPGHGRAWHAAGVAVGFALLAYVGAASVFWPWHRSWGSTRDELALALPGDPDLRDPALEVQHALTIDAAPEEIWPWLERTVGPGGDRDPSVPVAALLPPRALVLANRSAFVLVPTDQGQTRLIVRSTISERGIPVWASTLSFLAFEPPRFLRQRRMLLTIKALAEGQRGTGRVAAGR